MSSYRKAAAADADWDIEYKKGLKRPTLQVISNDMYTAAMNTLDGKDFTEQ